MVKSDLRKNRQTTVKTDRRIGWTDNVTTAQNVSESGGSIYIVPRKATAKFGKCHWYGTITDDISGDGSYNWHIYPTGPVDATVDTAAAELIQGSLDAMTARWQTITAVGIVNQSIESDVDIDVLISRASNLQGDDEYTIVVVYRSSSSAVNSLASQGYMEVEETLFQDIFADRSDEWAGYTFEESAY